MPIMSTIKPDHMPVNKYSLDVPGLGTNLTFVTVGSLEQELDTVDLPDRTAASGGRRKSLEFDVALPLHHNLEVLAMESWLAEGEDPVSPLYKKVGILTMYSLSRLGTKAYQLGGLFPSKRSTPELDMDNDGELATITFTMKADFMLAL